MATLQFKGKSAVWNHHLSVPYHTLEENAKKSFKGTDAEENLITEGDNLLALKKSRSEINLEIYCWRILSNRGCKCTHFCSELSF